ncbi:MAG: corrinoid protein [Bacteroidota bacterium]|nr:corrinoid protein [Bacteroidota bacterium]
MEELKRLAEFLENGYADRVAQLTQELLDNNVGPQIILNEGLIPGMAVVGEKMRKGEMFLPEVLQSAAAMYESLKILKPQLVEQGLKPIGKVLMGTVKGDMHDIGKNLVGILLQGAGFEIIDLGVNVPPQKFVEALGTHHPPILGISAMLTTTMLNMKTTIDAIANAGLREGVKIIVGGAPVSQKFADDIGADGYARDAVRAVDKVKELLAL